MLDQKLKRSYLARLNYNSDGYPPFTIIYLHSHCQGYLSRFKIHDQEYDKFNFSLPFRFRNEMLLLDIIFF